MENAKRVGLRIALVMVALSFLAFSPICAAMEADAEANPQPEVICCDAIDHSVSVASSIPKVPDAKPVALIAPRAGPRLAPAIRDPLAGVGPPGVPFSTTLSYYARSARILS